MFEIVRRSCKVLPKVKISDEFKQSNPLPQKLIKKTASFIAGEKLSPIYIDRDYNLIDGYCTYLIATTLGINKVKILQIREKRIAEEFCRGECDFVDRTHAKCR